MFGRPQHCSGFYQHGPIWKNSHSIVSLKLFGFEAKRYEFGILGSRSHRFGSSQGFDYLAEYYLQIEGFDYGKQVLENHLG